MNASLPVAVVGTGFLARTRLTCWRKVHHADVEVVVASRERARAEAFATEHGADRAASIDEVLADPSIQLVDLCVPNHAHAELCARAADAGKHVLCTKPLAAYWGQGLASDASAAEVAATDRVRMMEAAVGEAQLMVAACAKAGVQLFYGENWIFAPSVQRAAALSAASEGVTLEMRGWEAHSGSHAEYAKAWKTAGGGALMRLGSHPIGAMLQLKEEEGMRLHGKPTAVSAVTATTADLTRTAGLTEANTRIATGWQDVENWGMAVLHFADGSRGIVYGSDNCLGGMQSRLELTSSNAQYQCNLSPNDLLRSYAHDVTTFGQEYLMEKADTHAGWNTPIPDEDWSSGQLGMCQAFVADLQAQRAPLAGGALGVAVMQVLAAAYRSARTGSMVEL